MKLSVLGLLVPIQFALCSCSSSSDGGGAAAGSAGVGPSSGGASAGTGGSGQTGGTSSGGASSGGASTGGSGTGGGAQGPAGPRFVGRFTNSHQFAWSHSMVELRFTGTDISVTMAGASEWYEIVVDGTPKKMQIAGTA